MQRFTDMFKGRDIWWGPLILIFTFSLIGFGVYSIIKHKSLDGASLIIGGLISNQSLLLQFRYGSSKGSKDKDKTNTE